ncbi:hypothetical protein F66182_7 [Fusarium sp. NRRL 66182]|nr:hypothetical protein F66182_7 [Fusarium sp. NRRL 66182]
MPKAAKFRKASVRSSPFKLRSSSRVKPARSSSEESEEHVPLEHINSSFPSGSQTSSGGSFSSSATRSEYATSFTSEEHDAQPQQTPVLPSKTGTIARETYGNSIKIDSAFGKKLANETAERVPVQRRPNQLNMERRSNVEAYLAHMTGVEVKRECKNCAKGHGPWTECVIYDGQMCGSCTNCWFNASGSRCTFHESNHPKSIYAPSPVNNARSSGMPLQSALLPQAPVSASPNPSQQGSSHVYISPPVEQPPIYNVPPRQAAEELKMRLAEYEEELETYQATVTQQPAQSAEAEDRIASIVESIEDTSESQSH